MRIVLRLPLTFCVEIVAKILKHVHKRGMSYGPQRYVLTFSMDCNNRFYANIDH